MTRPDYRIVWDVARSSLLHRKSEFRKEIEAAAAETVEVGVLISFTRE